MADLSVDEIAQKGLALGILEQDQLQDVWMSFGSQHLDAESFLQALLRQGHLTKYQVDRLRNGDSTGFYYGDYKVLYPVGAGTFARVFRAVHRETGKTVAIKVLRNRYESDPEAIDLFIREAELGIGFRHPNIVPIHEVLAEKNAHFMVMDFIEGQTLRDFTNIRKKVEPAVATRIATDICRGLDYAFKRGHLHRDLKLTNVLLSSGGKALLCDFGLAASDNDSDDHKNQRSIDYAALERTTGVRRDDRRSDIFFLGTIFYHMLTGFPPMPEVKERAKRLDKTRFLSIRPIMQKDPTVPYALAFVVDKAMALDPEKRYQSPGAMLADLEVAAKKLASGTAGENPAARLSSLSLASAAKKNTHQSKVMIVEANQEMQNIFRESLKKNGFRALVLTSAERALERLEENDQEIDCILFNAQSLGTKAVLAFNEVGKRKLTEKIPSILLLDENQIKWAAKAMRAHHRVAVGMPITMKRLLEVLMKLISDKHKADRGEQQPLGTQPTKTSTFGYQQTSSFSRPNLSSPTASGIGLDSASGIGESASETRIEPLTSRSAGSCVNLSEEEEDPDYIAYIQEGGAGSFSASGSFTSEIFDAAISVEVDSIVKRVNALMGHTSSDAEPDKISAEEFLNAGKKPVKESHAPKPESADEKTPIEKTPVEESSANDDYDDEYGDYDYGDAD